jgi:hypothetical protein
MSNKHRLPKKKFQGLKNPKSREDSILPRVLGLPKNMKKIPPDPGQTGAETKH